MCLVVALFLFLLFLPRNLCKHCHSTFFFNDTATTEIYTLSLHDALPIYLLEAKPEEFKGSAKKEDSPAPKKGVDLEAIRKRSEEHTSELQSRGHLVCRLLLEKKKTLKTGIEYL